MAEDVVADIALKLWERKEKLADINSLKSYFYRSIHNACINHIRKAQAKAKNEHLYLVSDFQDEPSAIENIITTETYRELELAINALPSQCRKVFFNLFIKGKTLSETAEEMKLSLSTIKNQRQRGIKLLKKQLVGLGIFAWVATYCV